MVVAQTACVGIVSRFTRSCVRWNAVLLYKIINYCLLFQVDLSVGCHFVVSGLSLSRCFIREMKMLRAGVRVY